MKVLQDKVVDVEVTLERFIVMSKVFFAAKYVKHLQSTEKVGIKVKQTKGSLKTRLSKKLSIKLITIVKQMDAMQTMWSNLNGQCVF